MVSYFHVVTGSASEVEKKKMAAPLKILRRNISFSVLRSFRKGHLKSSIPMRSMSSNQFTGGLSQSINLVQISSDKIIDQLFLIWFVFFMLFNVCHVFLHGNIGPITVTNS